MYVDILCFNPNKAACSTEDKSATLDTGWNVIKTVIKKEAINKSMMRMIMFFNLRDKRLFPLINFIHEFVVEFGG